MEVEPEVEPGGSAEARSEAPAEESRLLQLDRGASLFELGLGSLGVVFGSTLQHIDWGTLDELLGIGESQSLSNPGTTYEPLPIQDQHAAINAYGLAFLNAHLKPPGHPLHAATAHYDAAYLREAHFDEAEVLWTPEASSRAES